MRMSRLVALGVMCFAGFVCQSSAFALTTGYTGRLCAADLQPPSSVSLTGAEAFTTSSSTVTWGCASVQTSTSLLSAHVVGRDKTPVGKVTCSIVATSETGTFGFVSPSQSSTVAGVGQFTFDFGPLSALANGSRLLRCTMPPWSGEGSSILSYTFVEG